MYLTYLMRLRKNRRLLKKPNRYIYPKNEKYGYGIGELTGIINTTLTDTVEKRIDD